LLLTFVLSFFTGQFISAQSDGIELNWLGNDAPSIDQGVTWGVPMPRGKVILEQHSPFMLSTSDGRELPLQTWPMAYWPDGSVKWMGCASVVPADHAGPYKLASKKIKDPELTIEIQKNETGLEINTGRLICRIPSGGNTLIGDMIINGKTVASDGRLVCSLQKSELKDGYRISLEENFVSEVKNVTIEQQGPVRAVIKIEGNHKSVGGDREWLPFLVRLYFYSNQASVKMVHTIIYDGDQHEDFIKGLGLTFSVPMREEIHNRHIRFTGQGKGLWAEPVQPMIGRGGRFVKNSDGQDVFPSQLAGDRMPDRKDLSDDAVNLLDHWAVWTGFRLIQPNADGFTIEKRTNAESSWIPAGAGERSSGLVFAGDVSGGLAVGVKDFWQSYPSSIEIHDADKDEATMNVWLWSPNAPVMDMRHYDTLDWGHGLDAVYEDVQPGFSTPYGIARTSVLTLYPTGNVPGKEEIVAEGQQTVQEPLLVCSPEYMHSTDVFGIWSLPDKSTPFKKAIEEMLEGYISYYRQSVDQRNWYGFWDYGDFMHSYDRNRHKWRYDLGGMAWDNTELGTDAWLWYSFLRTGRADIFRMAEAMTRHTTEVDCYHLGRFAGLGSRHNVRHWGGGAKELRISQASFRRFYYYLTCDERTGDAMHEVVNADHTLLDIDPMRLARPITEEEEKYPARARGGPDWLALAGNWMTEWERTGDTKYRDWIYTGMDCIAEMPYGFLTGPQNLFGYDPETKKLYPLTDDPFGTYNLTTIQGGAEVVFELNELIDHPGWQKAWLQYCRLHNAPKEVVQKDMKTGTEGEDGSYARPGRLAGYVYWKTGNENFIDPAVRGIVGWWGLPDLNPEKVNPPAVLNPVDELPWVGTNGAAQSSLQSIQVLEMCGDKLPEEIPEPERQRPRRMR
jgi:hypothetical protein